MRRLFWQMNVTLDGFMEGPNHELDDTAGVSDEGFDKYASDMLRSIDAVLLGRRTYRLFADYWPKATGADADRLNALPKIVFSRTLDKLEWSNSRVVRDNAGEEVARLKRQPGRDLALFGSADLAATFLPLGLIDEYRILITPVLLGRGTPMFSHTQGRIPLELVNATRWPTGMMALTYRPARGT
jgi:dihydrofolate reductase